MRVLLWTLTVAGAMCGALVLLSGLLFADEEALARSVLAIVKNRSAAGALGVRMREDFRRRFGIEAEIDRLLSAYAAA